MSATVLETAHAGGCWKKAYPSRAHALLDLDRIRGTHAQFATLRQPGKNNRKHRRLTRAHPTMPCRAYRCPSCEQWHLTSQEQRG